MESSQLKAGTKHTKGGFIMSIIGPTVSSALRPLAFPSLLFHCLVSVTGVPVSLGIGGSYLGFKDLQAMEDTSPSRRWC